MLPASALRSRLESDLGGSDRLTEGQRQFGTTAMLGAMLEDLEARWLTGASLELAEYCAAVNVQRRVLATIGLSRIARDATPDLRSYLASKAVGAQRVAGVLSASGRYPHNGQV